MSVCLSVCLFLRFYFLSNKNVYVYFSYELRENFIIDLFHHRAAIHRDLLNAHAHNVNFTRVIYKCFYIYEKLVHSIHHHIKWLIKCKSNFVHCHHFAQPSYDKCERFFPHLCVYLCMVFFSYYRNASNIISIFVYDTHFPQIYQHIILFRSNKTK